ncbi:hypothetical protein NPIL_695611 [Nephila pilipes]|uniref:Uncharacterized protein n=1 Tax=Nephila pilipes TaxID=299642 RepID=A0A8X6QXZ4_NEPPI|nr:hypothetical protein NPIL_695611 [Nephila pilipes]
MIPYLHGDTESSFHITVVPKCIKKRDFYDLSAEEGKAIQEIHLEWQPEEPRPFVVFSEWKLPVGNLPGIATFGFISPCRLGMISYWTPSQCSKKNQVSFGCEGSSYQPILRIFTQT